MDKVLRPERFDAKPNAQDASKSWRHWLTTFENFVEAIPGEEVKQTERFNQLCLLGGLSTILRSNYVR